MKFPRWMTWLFLGFMAYVLYLGNFGPKPEMPVGATTTSADGKTYPRLAEVTSLATWQNAIDPSAVTNLDITDTKTGSGMAAGCGSTVTITLRGTTPDGANFDDAHDEKTPLTFTVGKAPYPVLNEAVIGMQEGSVRHVRAPSKRVFADTQKLTLNTILLNITLTKNGDKVADDTTLPLTIVPIKPGDENIASVGCGEKATFSIRAVKADGSYGPAKTQHITLGDNDLGTAINRAMQGMRVNEQRLVLAPKAQKSPAIADGAILLTRLKKD